MHVTVKQVSHAFLAVLIAAMLAFTSFSAKAQENNSGGSGLRVSPTRTELSLLPGDSDQITQTVRNVTQSPVSVQPSLNDFEADGVTGQPQLIGDPNEISEHSLREFISLPDEFELQPDEEKELTVNLSVPQNAAPGAYFGSVLYRASPIGASNDGQVALVASVGSLVLLEVPGDITEQISIESVSAYVDDKAGSLFTQKPNNIGILVNNLGNGFAKPFGKIQVTDMRGSSIFEYELNDDQRRKNVLPESSRLFTQEFANVEERTVNGVAEQDKTNPIKWPGKYTISGNISHGTTGELFTVSSTFWYIPSWLVIAAVVLLIVLIAVAFFSYRKYKSKSLRRKK